MKSSNEPSKNTPQRIATIGLIICLGVQAAHAYGAIEMPPEAAVIAPTQPAPPPPRAGAGDVPTFKSGEYELTTSFGDSQTLSNKACLTDYADWFASLQDEVAERGCSLTAEGHSGSVYQYRMACTNGASGHMTVTKIDDSNFESVTQITLPIAGFEQTITTRDRAKRLGDCPPE